MRPWLTKLGPWLTKLRPCLTEFGPWLTEFSPPRGFAGRPGRSERPPCPGPTISRTRRGACAGTRSPMAPTATTRAERKKDARRRTFMAIPGEGAAGAVRGFRISGDGSRGQGSSGEGGPDFREVRRGDGTIPTTHNACQGMSHCSKSPPPPDCIARMYADG